MDERIKEFFASDERMREEEKAAVLIKLGFCKREYQPEKTNGSDREYSLYDVTKGQYYKLVPEEMDDETYLKVLNTRKAQSVLRDCADKPKISAVCYRLAGWVILLGILGSVFSFLLWELLVTLIVFIAAVIESTVLISAGKIIEYLHKYQKK